jgi:hypothetical protein
MWNIRLIQSAVVPHQRTLILSHSLQIYMHEAQRLWSESTGEEAPEVKLMESLFRHMTYRLDSTATVAVCL